MKIYARNTGNVWYSIGPLEHKQICLASSTPAPV